MSNVVNPFRFGAAPAVTSLSHVAFATSSAETITVPSTTNSGDVMVLFDRARQVGSVPTDVLPEDWEEIGVGDNTVTIRMRTSVKIADGSDASSSITGMNGGASNRKIIAVFRGNVHANTIISASSAIEITNDDPSAQVISSSGGTEPLVSVGGLTAVNLTGWSFSPTAGGSTDIGTDSRLAFKIYNSSTADVTVDTTDVGVNHSLGSFYIQVA